MENSCRGDICNIDVHRASYAKHLRSKNHLEIIRQNDIIIPEWLYKEEQTPVRKKLKKEYKHKALKLIARDNINLDDKELDEELAKKLNNPNYFIDENSKIGFKINLDCHSISHAGSILSITPFYTDVRIETRFIQTILKEMATIYAKLINQYKFKYHILFSASF